MKFLVRVYFSITNIHPIGFVEADTLEAAVEKLNLLPFEDSKKEGYKLPGTTAAILLREIKEITSGVDILTDIRNHEK